MDENETDTHDTDSDDLPIPKRELDVPDWVEGREFRGLRLHVHERMGESSGYSYSLYRFKIQETDTPKTAVLSDTTVDLEKMR